LVRNHNGVPQFAVITIEDIDARKQADQALRQKAAFIQLFWKYNADVLALPRRADVHATFGFASVRGGAGGGPWHHDDDHAAGLTRTGMAIDRLKRRRARHMPKMRACRPLARQHRSIRRARRRRGDVSERGGEMPATPRIALPAACARTASQLNIQRSRSQRRTRNGGAGNPHRGTRVSSGPVVP